MTATVHPTPFELDWDIDPRLDDALTDAWQQHVLDCNWLRLWPEELLAIETRTDTPADASAHVGT